MQALRNIISLFFTIILPVVALPPGFIDEGVTNVDAITGAFAAHPNTGKPMLMLSSKEGLIHVVPDPDNSDDFILVGNFTSITCSNGERGLQTILPHPRFVTNLYIYVYYTRFIANCPESATLGPSNRLSRYTMDRNTLQIDMKSEVVLMTCAPGVLTNHNGGSMLVGNDGFLYISTGDLGSSRPPYLYPQTLNNLQGKLLRLDLAGNSPPSNPFSKQSNGRGVPCRFTNGQVPPGSPANATCDEIYAYGLRNPFRMTLDPNTKDKTRIAIGDVGGSVWEEINEAGTDYKGTNYNWPTFEGPCERGSVRKCNRNGVGSPGTTLPFYYYEHTAQSRGGAITGSVFVPDGVWPAKYKYLFIDYVFEEIFNLIRDPKVACPSCIPPKPGYRNETFFTYNDMVDMFFGPYKDTRALYLISRSDGQNIRRIRYTGDSNRGPTAKIVASDTKILKNEVVVFDGSGSSDPDGDRLTYLWEFGDGTTSMAVKPQKKYSQFGQFVTTLTVTDTLGQTSQTFVLIVVGALPTATMVSPPKGKKFIVGEVIRLSGNATDARGNRIPNDRIFWEVRQHHAQHFHPFLDKRSGNNINLFPAPAPEDLTAAGNSYLEVIMSAVDSFGVTRTISRRVNPTTRTVDILSSPPGLDVLIDESPIRTPGSILTWQNQDLRLDVKNQKGFVFDRWNIGGRRMRPYNVKAPLGGIRQNITAIMKLA